MDLWPVHQLRMWSWEDLQHLTFTRWRSSTLLGSQSGRFVSYVQRRSLSLLVSWKNMFVNICKMQLRSTWYDRIYWAWSWNERETPMVDIRWGPQGHVLGKMRSFFGVTHPYHHQLLQENVHTRSCKEHQVPNDSVLKHHVLQITIITRKAWKSIFTRAATCMGTPIANE